MTIAEMHVWFRQYAQQMGMQNVRAILPEQIDLVINSSITDTVNQIITQNIGVTNDRIITDNSKIGQINALRSLYKVNEVGILDTIFKESGETHIKRIYVNTDDLNYNSDKYYAINASGTPVETTDATYDAAPDVNKLGVFYSDQQNEIKALAVVDNANKFYVVRNKFNYLYLVDLSISYTRDGNINDVVRTNFFPVRLIDDAYLADTLNDFVLRPRLRTPIAVLYNNLLDLYIDELSGNKLPQNLNPYVLRVSYISKPAKVEYLSDIGGKNVDCDLPDYMHVDILKHAVDLYNTAISGGMYAAQQQQQNQNREMSRNQARPDNEGYQN